MKTVSALYDSFNQANSAVQELSSNGFQRDSVSLVSSDTTNEYGSYFDKEGRYIDQTVTPDGSRGDRTSGEGAAAGAGIGAALGGLGGVLMGLGLLVIPGVGPALAAGALASGLIGAGIGGVAGGITGALVNAGVPKTEAEYYAEGLKRGGHLVVVTTSDDRGDLAQEILGRHGPVDMQQRSKDWRDEGWTGFDSALPNPVNQDLRR
jgi:hypothetical protein